VALAHVRVLGVEHLGDELGIGAVDDQLQALAGERVLDAGQLLVEGQEPVAARLLGVADELVHLRVEVRRRGAEGFLVQRRDVLDGLEARPRHGGAERAAEDDQEGGGVEHRHDVRALERRAERDAADGDGQADG
jgi:hypothetical protein